MEGKEMIKTFYIDETKEVAIDKLRTGRLSTMIITFMVGEKPMKVIFIAPDDSPFKDLHHCLDDYY